MGFMLKIAYSIPTDIYGPTQSQTESSDSAPLNIMRLPPFDLQTFPPDIWGRACRLLHKLPLPPNCGISGTPF